jgi:hypothetical protein
MWGLVLAAGLILGAPWAGQAQQNEAKDVYLQTIGLLAGQGLVLGHENLQGIAARYEKRQLTKEKALLALAVANRYAQLVLAMFSERLMGQLDGAAQQDLKLLIGYYEVQRGAIVALTDYVRSGGAKNREAFHEMQDRVEAVIRQITLPAGKS